VAAFAAPGEVTKRSFAQQFARPYGRERRCVRVSKVNDAGGGHVAGTFLSGYCRQVDDR